MWWFSFNARISAWGTYSVLWRGPGEGRVCFMGVLISLFGHKIALSQFQVNAEPRTCLTRTYLWEETQIPVWRGHSQFLFSRSLNHVQLFVGRVDMEELKRLRKECLFTIFSLNFLGSNSKRTETTKGVPQQLWPQTGGGVEYWASTLAFHSFPGVCSLINK